MRRGPSHCLETNRAVYGISDVVRQIVSACCPQDTTAQPPLLILCEPTLLVGYKPSIVLSFPRNFVKDRIFYE